MPSVLVTGANRGLGLEFARQYAADGWKVYACCRAPDAAADLNALAGDVTVLALDVTSKQEVAMLSAFLDGAPVDVLVNNAGIYGPKNCGLGEVNDADFDRVMRVNVYGLLRMTRALLNNVAASELKTVATLGSKMGSMADNTSGGSYIYRASKAAVNAAMKSLSHDVAPLGVSVVTLHPGWVRTDMGGPGGLIDAPESVAGMRRVIAETGPAASGRFVAYDGKEIPW